MRTYGRENGGKGRWVIVTTDANGYDDAVWLTTLGQSLRLNLGESPFFADYGIAAHQAVMQQVYPDYYIAYMQAKFAPRFASLSIARLPNDVPPFTPTYRIVVVTQQGSTIVRDVPI